MTTPPDRNIAIVGGGRMGLGIAFVFAYGGYEVAICEPNERTRNALLENLEKICRKLDVDASRLSTIAIYDSLTNAVSNCLLAIEAAPESLALKRHIFAELDSLAPQDAILASNTSSIPIADIAADVRSKGRVIGTHFWNPPHLIELVEVVKGRDSDSAACERAIEILNHVRMTPVLVKKDVPGIIGNRLQHAMKREAIALVAEGVCDAQTLDSVVKKGFGARLGVMGPLEQSDLLGLELTLAIHETLIQDLDVTRGPHQCLRDLIAAGKLGASSGEGFRRWTQEEADKAKTALDDFLVEKAKERYRA